MRKGGWAFCLWLVVSCGATPLGNVFIPSTGIDLLGDGFDDYYQLIYLPSGPLSTPAPAYLALNQTTICPNTGGCWVTGADSSWISSMNLRDDENMLPGQYQYRTYFDLSGFAPESLVISGWWAADGWGSDILINGKSTGVTTQDPRPNIAANYLTLAPISIFHDSCAGGCFLPGVNELILVVNNGGWETGVRAQFIGEAELSGPLQVIPEPGAWSLLASGLLATVWLRRRRLPR